VAAEAAEARLPGGGGLPLTDHASQTRGRVPQEAVRRAQRNHLPQGQGHPAGQRLDLLGEDNKHVAADLRKAASGAAVSPILLLRGDDEHPLIIADGYHRVCASYWIDENTDIPCILV
jgi:hypothetical protein